MVDRLALPTGGRKPHTWMHHTASIAKAIRVAFTAALLGVSLPISALAQTQSLNLVWDPSSSTDIDHYNVYIGTSPAAHDVAIRTVLDTTYTFAATAGVLYYFGVSAVSTAGLESPISAEISGSVPLLSPLASRADIVGRSISEVRVTAVDPDGGILRFSHTGLPFGLTLDPVTGMITGTPRSIGTYNVTIFVSDGVSTSSRSFLWTVQSPGSADVTAPTLSITSHSAGQVVNASSITLSGTATDSGSGDSGITSVTINGLLVAGTASGSGTVNWSRGFTLTSGINTILVEAQDGSGNLAAQQITLIRDLATAPPAAVITAESVTPGSGSGTSQTFALRYSDTLGATDLSTAWVWFNPLSSASVSSANSCLVYYDRAAARIYLVNDGATEWVSSLLASGAALQNSQCVVSLAGSSVTTSGTTLTLNLAVTFLPAFAGAKHIYMYGASGNVNSGWHDRGDWVVPSAGGGPVTVTAVSATPNTGSGATQTFALRYSDTLGATDLSTAWVWFNPAPSASVSAANSCLVYYDRAAARIYLVNDGATEWVSSLLASGATMQNSQCVVSLAGSSVTTSGTTLTLNLAVTFKPPFAGAKNIYMYAENVAGVSSGWQSRGFWTSP